MAAKQPFRFPRWIISWVVSAFLASLLVAHTPVQAQTPCAPAGSLWHETYSRMQDASLDFKPRLTLALPAERGRAGAVALSQAVGSGIIGPRRPIVDATALYGGSAAAPALGENSFYGVIIPPGSNNILFSGVTAETGRAGAIALVPQDPQSFCERTGAPGLLIHSGKLTDPEVLRKFPSLIMEEDHLAQLIGDFLAAASGKTNLVGKPYAEIAKGIQGIIGYDAFAPFDASVVIRSTSPGAMISGRSYGANVAAFPLAGLLATTASPALRTLSWQELDELHDQIGSGYFYWFREFMEKSDSFTAQIGRLGSDLKNPSLTSEQLQAKIQETSAYSAEVLVFIPNYLKILEEAQAAGELPEMIGSVSLTKYIQGIRDLAEQLKTFRFELQATKINFERLEAAKRLNLQRELDPPPLATAACVLKPIKRDIPRKPVAIGGHQMNVDGKAALFFREGAAGTQNVVPWIRAAVNVTEFKTIQSQLAANMAKEKSTDCGWKFKIDSNQLVANGEGELNGATHFAIRAYACITYKTPCWKRWKQYWCKHTSATHMATFGSNSSFRVLATTNPSGYGLKVRGAANIDEHLDIEDVVGTDAQLTAARKTLSLRPDAAYFSENDAGLWLVLEMRGAPKLSALMCASQSGFETMDVGQ